jgi:hypothetical protein
MRELGCGKEYFGSEPEKEDKIVEDEQSRQDEG